MVGVEAFGMSTAQPPSQQPPPPDRSRNPFVSSTFRHRETRAFFAARGRNAAVGLTLFAFVAGVFAYSVTSVSRNDFAKFDKDGIAIKS